MLEPFAIKSLQPDERPLAAWARSSALVPHKGAYAIMSIKNRKAADIESTDSDDPRDAGPGPEYPQGTIEYPGSEEAMTPRADHGETCAWRIAEFVSF